MAFGRPNSAGVVRPRSAPWSAHGIDKNFTEFNNVLKRSTINSDSNSTATPPDQNLSARPKSASGRLPSLVSSPETDAPDTTPNVASKKSSSYRLNQHITTYVDRKESRRGYRVLYSHVDITGKYIMLHDILDNTMYHCGTVVNTSLAKKASYVPLFESKLSALSEKFPDRSLCNLIGAQRHKNGKYARVLASFDAWGICQRRVGGPPAVIFEHAKFIKIVEFLDCPPPRQTPGRAFYTTFSSPGRPSREHRMKGM
jgi:hypothetical protein